MIGGFAALVVAVEAFAKIFYGFSETHSAVAMCGLAIHKIHEFDPNTGGCWSYSQQSFLATHFSPALVLSAAEFAVFVGVIHLIVRLAHRSSQPPIAFTHLAMALVLSCFGRLLYDTCLLRPALHVIFSRPRRLWHAGTPGIL